MFTSAASSETLNALFVGGYSEAFLINAAAKLDFPIIARLDLAQNTWSWRKVFDLTSFTMDTVSALALNPDGTSLAAHGTAYSTSFVIDHRAFIFIVRAEDGHYLSDVHVITHALDKARGSFNVQS